MAVLRLRVCDLCGASYEAGRYGSHARAYHALPYDTTVTLRVWYDRPARRIVYR